MQVLVLSVSRDCVILCLYTLVGHGNVMKPDTLTEPEPEEGAMGQEMREFKLGTVTRRESAGRHKLVNVEQFLNICTCCLLLSLTLW